MLHGAHDGTCRCCAAPTRLPTGRGRCQSELLASGQANNAPLPGVLPLLPVLVLTARFKVSKADAQFLPAFRYHSRGHIGSPMVAGSTNRRRSSSTAGLDWLNAGSATAFAAHPLAGHGCRQKVSGPANDCAVRHAYRSRHRRGFLVTGGNLLRVHEQATTELIQLVSDGYVACANRGLVGHSIIAHRTTLHRNPLPVEVIIRVSYSCMSLNRVRFGKRSPASPNQDNTHLLRHLAPSPIARSLQQRF